MPEEEADLIRLSLPADGDLRPVAEVAVAVVARRLGFDDDEVRSARSATGDAYAAMTGNGELGIDLEIQIAGRRLAVRLRRGDEEREVSLPRREV